MAFLDETGVEHLWAHIVAKLGGKADAVNGVVQVAKGGTGATAKGATLLSNIGISTGTAAAPSTGTAGTIYIQYEA